MSNPVFIPALCVGIPVISPPGTIVISGSVCYQYVAVTSAYTVSSTDKTVNCTANSFTVTLPSAVGVTGREYLIKNTGAGVITVDGVGSETIDGALNFILRNDGDPAKKNGVAVLSNGANWIITSKIFN